MGEVCLGEGNQIEGMDKCREAVAISKSAAKLNLIEKIWVKTWRLEEHSWKGTASVFKEQQGFNVKWVSERKGAYNRSSRVGVSSVACLCK